MNAVESLLCLMLLINVGCCCCGLQFAWHVSLDERGLPAAAVMSNSGSTSAARMAEALSERAAASFSAVSTQPTKSDGVQLASAPTQLSSRLAYDFSWWSAASNSSIQLLAVLVNLLTNKTAAALKFTPAVGSSRSQQTMRFVQPPADGLYSWQIWCGASTGTFWFDSLAVSESSLDSWNASEAQQRISSIRRGTFQLAVVDAGSGAALDVRRLNLTLIRHAFHFGTAIEPEVVKQEQPESYQWYKDTIGETFWSITPENRFKWPEYEPKQGNYQQAAEVLEQQYLALAAQHGMDLVRGHTLEWGKSYADCVSGKSRPCFWAVAGFNCSLWAEALKHRVQRDVSLFKGRFRQYDVINEFIEVPGMLQQCNLTASLLPELFRIAAAADPEAQLCLNEWDMLTGTNWQGMLDLVARLRAAGAPPHCIGVQAHLNARRASADLIWTKLNQLGATGLPLFVTELSLSSSMQNGHPVSNLTEAEQAALMQELVTLMFSHPSVKGVTLWGFWDGHIWNQGGGIFRRDKSPKPAAIALRELWTRTWNTTLVNLSSIQRPASAPLPSPAKASSADGSGSSSSRPDLVSAELTPAGDPLAGLFMAWQPDDDSGSAAAVLPARAVGQLENAADPIAGLFLSSGTSSPEATTTTSSTGTAKAGAAAAAGGRQQARTAAGRALLAGGSPCLDAGTLDTFSFFFGGGMQLCGAPAPPPPRVQQASSTGSTSIIKGASQQPARAGSHSSSSSTSSSSSSTTSDRSSSAGGVRRQGTSVPGADAVVVPVKLAAPARAAPPMSLLPQLRPPPPPPPPPSQPPLLPPVILSPASAPPTASPQTVVAIRQLPQQLLMTAVQRQQEPAKLRAGAAQRAVAAATVPAAKPAALSFTGFYGIYRYEFVAGAGQQRFSGTLDLRPLKPKLVRLRVAVH